MMVDGGMALAVGVIVEIYKGCIPVGEGLSKR
jgi:hypothetical protein